MSFSLVESLDHVGYYGDIPEPLPGYESDFDEFGLEQGDIILLKHDFVDPINKACGTLLDYGDVDYFDASRCKRLCLWLEGRLSRGCDGRLAMLYRNARLR
ncbi:MAG: hypothetical protein ACI4B9_07810 [Eggerthellaceae bacterium]